MRKGITIFYAWQDNLDARTNKNAIRKSLELIKTNLKNLGIIISIDEATRNEAGSPNIPATILKKISKADIFVGDTTIINSLSKTGEKTPNPNVIFELGYAVSEIGWERVILLFNRFYGSSKDLPFDFDRHRAAMYTLTTKLEEQEIQSLNNLLAIAVKEIVNKDPQRPAEIRGLSAEEIKKKSDITNLKWILSTFHVPSMEEFIHDDSYKIRPEIFFFWEEFTRIFASSLFHIYDPKLKNNIKQLHKYWNTTLSYSDLYAGNNKAHTLFLSTKKISIEQEVALKDIDHAKTKMNEVLKCLQRMIREKYLEIDPIETSQQAIKTFRLYSNS